MVDPGDIAIDVTRQTIRGRACPRCGGKIIPSNRAVYQSAANPAEVISLWQCERCGYEEMVEPPKVEKKEPHRKQAGGGGDEAGG
jgi:ribosomal protein S27AE